jgi:hypothetical protein
MVAFGTASLFWSETVPSISPFKACDWAKVDGDGAANRMPAAMAQVKGLDYLSQRTLIHDLICCKRPALYTPKAVFASPSKHR